MSTPTIGDVLRDLKKARDAKDKAQGVLTAAAQEVADIEDTLLLMMKAADTTLVSGSGLRVAIQDKDIPQVVDWAAFGAFVLRKKALHLLQRRLSTGAYDELAATVRGGVLPGCGTFTKTTLSVRSE